MGDDEGSRLTNSQIPRNHPSFIIRLAIQWKGRSRAKSTSGVGENALFPPTSLREDWRGVHVGQNILHVRSFAREVSAPSHRPQSALRSPHRRGNSRSRESGEAFFLGSGAEGPAGTTFSEASKRPPPRDRPRDRVCHENAEARDEGRGACSHTKLVC